MLQNLNTLTKEPKAGEIWWADIPNAIGSQQGGKHPVLIVSNNMYNGFSPMTNAFPITSQIQKASPVHVEIKKGEVSGLYKDSAIQIEAPWNLNRTQLIEKVGVLPQTKEREVAEKMVIQFPMLRCLLNIVN